MNLPQQLSVKRLGSMYHSPGPTAALLPAAECQRGEVPCHCRYDDAECCPAGTRCDCSTGYNRCLGTGERRIPALRAAD